MYMWLYMVKADAPYFIVESKYGDFLTLGLITIFDVWYIILS
tara:strand:- start:44 stop:169 length:126 start_codon:yes stop_codon:yes gene_type:complete